MNIFQTQESPYDWNFKVLGIPVRVQPWFWLIAGIIAFQYAPPNQGMLTVLSIVAAICVIFVSILGHELGHALAIRKYQNGYPSITLMGMGGYATGGRMGGVQGARRVICAGNFVTVSIAICSFLALGFLPPESSLLLRNSLKMAVFVNIFWFIFNSLPVYPMDGGQLLFELMGAHKSYGHLSRAQNTSMGMGAGLAVFFLLVGQVIAALLLGFFCYQLYLMKKMR